MTHAYLAPSAAHRWMHCPAAPELESLFPEETSEYAEEGTKAHALAAAMLTGGTIPTDVPGDMRGFVQSYVDKVKETVGADGALQVEVPLDISAITGEEGAHGTADAVVFTPDGILHVIDLKYGRGVKVEAVLPDGSTNPQLLIYAAAALNEYALYAPKGVEMTIIQPRLSHWSSASYAVGADFDRDVQKIRIAAAQVRKGAPACPSEDACRFCRARGACKALAARVFSDIADDAVTIDTAAEKVAEAVDRTYDNEELSRLLGCADLIEIFLKSIRERAYNELSAGNNVAGYKLVAGRKGARKWADAHAAELRLHRLLGEACYSKELLSPAQVEKLVKKGMLPGEELDAIPVTQAEGKPTVVPESDKRESLSVMNDFDIVE